MSELKTQPQTVSTAVLIDLLAAIKEEFWQQAMENHEISVKTENPTQKLMYMTVSLTLQHCSLAIAKVLEMQAENNSR